MQRVSISSKPAGLAVQRASSRKPGHQRAPRAPLGVVAFKDDSKGAKKTQEKGMQQTIPPSIPDAPDTMRRAVPEGLDKVLANPGQPRANMSCDKENPQGVLAVAFENGQYKLVEQPSNLTVLEQHVAYWDRDGDGIIWPGDTYVGFRRLGFSILISALAVPLIHGAFSPATQKTWLIDPRLPLKMNRIHKAKHGSDSEIYDTEGRFVPQKFEELFSKYDRDGKNALNWDDIGAMVKGNANAGDPFGWTAERLEWYVTYLLIAREMPGQEQRVIVKDDVRGVLDGTIFFRIADDLERHRIEGRGPFKAGFKAAK